MSDFEMTGLDIIGDVHGNLEPLRRLLNGLGYDEQAGWTHPDRRRLLFLGDLIDRGPHSLEVAELVRGLCGNGYHLCLLGNHELNIVEWRRGRTGIKGSNRDTIESIEAHRQRWDPILDFFETLPIAVEFDELRVTHAVWHQGCFDQLEQALRTPSAEQTLSGFWKEAVRLHSPFEGGVIRQGVPVEPYPGQWEKSLEVFVKGHEAPARIPFKDNDGTPRDQERAMWWQPNDINMPRDKRIVFGHYWNLAPIPVRHDQFVPPHPSGHPDLRRWADEHHRLVDDEGCVPVPINVGAVCVDFNGMTNAGHRACVGAYRHPDAEVAWRAVELDGERRRGE